MANVTAAHEEFELSKKHEEILEKRALLLQQMQAQYEQQKAKKKQRLMSQAAHKRNAQILQHLENVEKNLHTRQLLHPDVIHLETRYWASVEEKLTEWEQYLLGKGQPPVSNTGTSFGHLRLGSGQQHPSPGRGKPPRPKPRSAV